MIIKQLFDQSSSTYTYLIADEKSGEAALIDSVKEHSDEYISLLNTLGLTLIYSLDTHTHADHITANGVLRDLTSCTTLLGNESESQCVDKRFNDKDQFNVGDIIITVLHTPGHTIDSYCFHIQYDKQDYLFTGDTLLINGSGRCDFQNGSAHDQYHSIFNILLKYPDSTIIYPGHDYNGLTQSSVAKEKAENPRLQVENKEAYVALMEGLVLPNPKLMDIAVPANQACGQP